MPEPTQNRRDFFKKSVAGAVMPGVNTGVEGLNGALSHKQLSDAKKHALSEVKNAIQQCWSCEHYLSDWDRDMSDGDTIVINASFTAQEDNTHLNTMQELANDLIKSKQVLQSVIDNFNATYGQLTLGVIHSRYPNASDLFTSADQLILNINDSEIASLTKRARQYDKFRLRCCDLIQQHLAQNPETHPHSIEQVIIDFFRSIQVKINNDECPNPDTFHRVVDEFMSTDWSNMNVRQMENQSAAKLEKIQRFWRDKIESDAPFSKIINHNLGDKKAFLPLSSNLSRAKIFLSRVLDIARSSNIELVTRTNDNSEIFQPEISPFAPLPPLAVYGVELDVEEFTALQDFVDRYPSVYESSPLTDFI